jgi:hypothetical protein
MSPRFPLLVAFEPCIRWGLPSRGSLEPRWWSLTPPFHPDLFAQAVYFLWHFPSASHLDSCRVTRSWSARRPAVSWHHALRCPDFPHLAARPRPFPSGKQCNTPCHMEVRTPCHMEVRTPCHMEVRTLCHMEVRTSDLLEPIKRPCAIIVQIRHRIAALKIMPKHHTVCLAPCASRLDVGFF